MSTKRAKLALRFFTYGVMAVSTILLTGMAIFYAMGYRFNQSNLRIEQGGLVQLRSMPESASVFVDGKEKNDLRTPSRAYLSAGKHSIEMRLNGYQVWKRDFELQAGQLLWLDYARLMPSNITTSPVRAFGGVTAAEFSPDRRWLILNETPSASAFTLFDLSDETKPVSTVTTIPADQLTHIAGQTERFSLIEWDFGSRSVLVRHDVGDVHEVLRIDRTKPDTAVNISRLFGLAIDQVHFAGGNQSVVYAQTGNVLRRLDVDSSTASATLVAGVKSFTVYGEDRIAFVANQQVTENGVPTMRQVVGTYQNGKEVIARDYPVDASLHIALTEYFRHQYLAISSGDNMVEILRDPAEKAAETPVYASFNLGKEALWLTFSSNGRMLAAGNGNAWSTYDLEVAGTYSGTINKNVDLPLKWLDDYYLWTEAEDTLQVVEFDGQNRREITRSTNGFPVSLSQNGKSLFSFSKSDASVIMQDSRLVLP